MAPRINAWGRLERIRGTAVYFQAKVSGKG